MPASKQDVVEVVAVATIYTKPDAEPIAAGQRAQFAADEAARLIALGHARPVEPEAAPAPQPDREAE